MRATLGLLLLLVTGCKYMPGHKDKAEKATADAMAMSMKKIAVANIKPAESTATSTGCRPTSSPGPTFCPP